MPINSINEFINGLPKAELHLHICGTLEPAMMFKLAERNKVKLPYTTVDEVRAAYQFSELQEFLDIYHDGTLVLQEERDFYELTAAYLRKARSQNVRYAEISIDPQTFIKRGIPYQYQLDGMLNAIKDVCPDIDMECRLVVDFIRDFHEDDGIAMLKLIEPYYDDIIAIGIGSTEIGHPPEKFERAFKLARELGFHTTAHSGEEGPAEYVRGTVDILQVERIDHGVRSLDDAQLVRDLADRQIPLTLCPLSNQALQVTPDLTTYPIREMLKQRMLITINSDDPSYFHGYVNENYLAVAEALDLSEGILAGLAKNSFKASFLPEEKKMKFIEMVDDYYHGWEAKFRRSGNGS